MKLGELIDEIKHRVKVDDSAHNKLFPTIEDEDIVKDIIQPDVTDEIPTDWRSLHTRLSADFHQAVLTDKKQIKSSDMQTKNQLFKMIRPPLFS